MNKVKMIVMLTLVLTFAMLATACGTAPSAPVAATGKTLDTSYPNALNARSLLLLGIVRLEEGKGPALSKEQAKQLLPLWQTSKALTASGNASQAEQDAITNQMLAVLTDEQVKAINALKLTAADMQTCNQSLGVTMSPEAGVPGGGQNLSPQERATRQAQRGGTSGNTTAIDAVIKLLEQKAK
ncbi:MAG: hypothetical protein HZC40_04660 [Chloroflexi bacterium]|nr:hypothetical protein [Chloroflexota bacterium]